MATVAHVMSAHDVHPLLRQHPSLRHPRPITRDFAKAQRMLGLVADSEETATGIQRQRSKTTKWLERPMYAHLDVSDVESEKEEELERMKAARALETRETAQDALLLKQWTSPDQPRPTSFHSENRVQSPAEPETKLDTTLVKRRSQPLTTIRPVSYNPQPLLSPEWTASPAALSPNINHKHLAVHPKGRHVSRGSESSISSSGSDRRTLHPQTWPAPPPQYRSQPRAERPFSYQPPNSRRVDDNSPSLGSPEQRPRPTSFATWQHRDRRNSKIASSRGLRNNSYPNFSRPNPALPTAIPGEHIEGDIPFNRSTENEVGPQSAVSPVRDVFSRYEIGNGDIQGEKKPKNRWSNIPQTLKKFTRRRSSAAAEQAKQKADIKHLRRANLTDQSLLWHENEAWHVPATPTGVSPTRNLLPTPSYSPLGFQHQAAGTDLPKPFAPWADGPPSPSLSHDKRLSWDMSLSPTRKRASSRLSVENLTPSRPESMHSRNSSLGMPSPMRYTPLAQPQVMLDPTASPRAGSRRGTPSLERTCILCRTTKDPAAFVSRRISGNCWHEPATCFQCLQSHIERCVTSRGWEACSCPECGERMTYEDLGAFADDDTLIKWDE